MPLDEGVSHDDSFAKYAVAFFSMSRSIRVRGRVARKHADPMSAGRAGFTTRASCLIAAGVTAGAVKE